MWDSRFPDFSLFSNTRSASSIEYLRVFNAILKELKEVIYRNFDLKLDYRYSLCLIEWFDYTVQWDSNVLWRIGSMQYIHSTRVCPRSPFTDLKNCGAETNWTSHMPHTHIWVTLDGVAKSFYDIDWCDGPKWIKLNRLCPLGFLFTTASGHRQIDRKSEICIMYRHFIRCDVLRDYINSARAV
jgi:hypothetical protein